MRRHAWLFLFVLSCSPAKNDDPCPTGICGGTNDGGGPMKCQEAWTCTAWQKGNDGKYTRTCTDSSACGTTAQKPTEGPIALPDLDVDYFKCKVQPIFAHGCGMMGCHGTDVGRPFKVYARGRWRRNETVPQVSSCPIGPQMVNLQKEGSGTVMCVGWSALTQGEWQENYDNARGFAVGLASADDSELLSQPVFGGKAHAGVHLFKKTDPDYQTIRDWLAGSKLGMACNTNGN